MTRCCHAAASRSACAAVPDFEIVAQCANGREALAAVIQQYRPDLVFLDIQMPGMSGLEVLAHLPQESLPVPIFVTAYDQYAIQAFEARAVDYLLKPIDDARFELTLERVREHVRAQEAPRLSATASCR